MARIKPSSFLFGAAAGAAIQYFLDPETGNRRRSVASDKAGRYMRQGRQAAEQQASQAANVAKGAAVETAKSAPGVREAADREAAERLNDPALARKVETAIFRDADVPKGNIAVNAEEGVVYLRGEVEDPDQIAALGRAASEVEGVGEVENLLHKPGEPAPMKS